MQQRTKVFTFRLSDTARLRTADAVARDLAHVARVSPREVGYAGRKRRQSFQA